MSENGPADVAERFTTGGWLFTPAVAAVFDEHVRASVPFYDAIQDLVAETSDWLLPDGGVVADLGASTGTTVARIAARHPGRQFRAFLYDEEASMLERAQRALVPAQNVAVEYVNGRIQEPLQHWGADLTLSLFTLQFLPLPARLATLKGARAAAAETGALIVAEKIRATDSRWAEIGNDASHDYKADRGVTDAAIRAKAKALRGVLRPHPASTLADLIVRAGWQAPEVLFRWHTWQVVGAFAGGGDG